MFNVDLNLFFSFKCLFKKYHFKLIGFLVVIKAVVFAIILQSLEGKNLSTKNNNLADYIWTNLVIVSTVGYGDIVAQTNLGRFGTILVAFYGIIVVALLIMSLQAFFNLNSYEAIAFGFVNRVKDKDELKSASRNYIKSSLLYSVSKKRFIKQKIEINKLNTTGQLSNKKRKKLQKNCNNKLSIVKKSILNNLLAKTDLKKKLNSYYNTHEPYSEAYSIKKRIKFISDKIIQFKDNEYFYSEKLEKLKLLFDLLEDEEFSSYIMKSDNLKNKISMINNTNITKINNNNNNNNLNTLITYEEEKENNDNKHIETNRSNINNNYEKLIKEINNYEIIQNTNTTNDPTDKNINHNINTISYDQKNNNQLLDISNNSNFNSYRFKFNDLTFHKNKESNFSYIKNN